MMITSQPHSPHLCPANPLTTPYLTTTHTRSQQKLKDATITNRTSGVEMILDWIK
jgi:hypothetical protein